MEGLEEERVEEMVKIQEIQKIAKWPGRPVPNYMIIYRNKACAQPACDGHGTQCPQFSSLLFQSFLLVCKEKGICTLKIP